jgi:AcrR family transcriptional regulator
MSDHAGAIGPLPRGRHNLSRGQVEASQRLRLSVAMAEACADAGFVDTSVKAVLARANVSRLTFYELYDGKLDCFLEALDLVGSVLLGQLRYAVANSAGTPLDRATHAVDHYLDAIVENLPFARLYIVEVHAAGPAALIRRAELQGQVVDVVAEVVGAQDADGRFACEAYVAAVSALVTLPVATGDLAAIRALRDPLVSLIHRLVRS